MARFFKISDAFMLGLLSVFGAVPSPRDYTSVRPPRIMSESEALRHDWQAIGDDLYKAIDSYEQKFQEEQEA